MREYASYTEKTHAAFGDQPINTADAKVLSWLIRRHGLEMTHLSRGSHIGAIFSLAEIMATLYTGVLNVDPQQPKMDGRDRLILSKGHAGAAVYAALAERGFFPVEELSTHYADGSRLSGHVSHKGVPGVEFSVDYLDRELHILALYIQPEHYDAAMGIAERLNENKKQSNLDLIANLNKAGYNISYEKIKASMPAGEPKRALIAAELT